MALFVPLDSDDARLVGECRDQEPRKVDVDAQLDAPAWNERTGVVGEDAACDAASTRLAYSLSRGSRPA